MIYKRIFAAGLAAFLLVSAVSAQKAEVTVSLNEPFFDALLDSVFQNFDPLEFSIAKNDLEGGEAEGRRTLAENGKLKREDEGGTRGFSTFLSQFSISPASRRLRERPVYCKESVRILREMNGVRTAVRFRDGKIYVPLAFSGNYAPPFVGCVEFAGWAETNIDLEFDRDGQRLVGRARVLNVNLNGTGGVGGTVIARLIQRSIDKKLNPIEIIRLDKLSFAFPVRSGTLRMKALIARPELAAGSLNIHVTYEFLKG